MNKQIRVTFQRAHSSSRSQAAGAFPSSSGCKAGPNNNSLITLLEEERERKRLGTWLGKKGTLLSFPRMRKYSNKFSPHSQKHFLFFNLRNLRTGQYQPCQELAQDNFVLPHLVSGHIEIPLLHNVSKKDCNFRK